MTYDEEKRQAAEAALAFVPEDKVLGVGTGSTVDYFIDALTARRLAIQGAVSSSERTTQALKKNKIAVLDLNALDELSVYVDGADECDSRRCLIKGGGGALTREKIIASMAKTFICLIDSSKRVDVLGQFPLPVEVIPMARTYVARELARYGGKPRWREGLVTDNGNVILDVHGLRIEDPLLLEREWNQISGVVTVGLFAQRVADIVLVGKHRMP